MFEAILGKDFGNGLINKAAASGLAFDRKLREEEGGNEMNLPPVVNKALYDAAQKIMDDRLLSKLGVGDTATDEDIAATLQELFMGKELRNDYERYALLGKYQEDEEKVDPRVVEGNKKIDAILLELYKSIKLLCKEEEIEDIVEWFYSYLHEDLPLQEKCGSMTPTQKKFAAIAKAKKRKKVRTKEGKLTEQDDDEKPSMVTGPAKKPYKDDSIEGDASAPDGPSEEPDKEAPPEVEPEEAKITEKTYLGKSGNSFYYINPVTEGEEGSYQVVDQEGKIVFSLKDSEEATSDVIEFIIAAVRDIQMENVSSDIFLKFFVPAIEKKQKEEGEYAKEEEEGEPPKEEEYPEEGEVGKREEEMSIRDSKLSEIKVVSNNREFDVQLKEDSSEFVTLEINGKPFRFGAEFARMYKREGKMTEESIKGLALDALSNMPTKTFDELAIRNEEDTSEGCRSMHKSMKKRKKVKTKEGKIPDFGLDKQDDEEVIIDKLTEVEGDGLRRPGPPIFNDHDKEGIRAQVEKFIKEATPEQLGDFYNKITSSTIGVNLAKMQKDRVVERILEYYLDENNWDETLALYRKIKGWGKKTRESLTEDEKRRFGPEEDVKKVVSDIINGRVEVTLAEFMRDASKEEHVEAVRQLQLLIQKYSLEENFELTEDSESIAELTKAVLKAIDEQNWDKANELAKKISSKTYMKGTGKLGVREGSDESFEDLAAQARKAVEDKDWKKLGELAGKASSIIKGQGKSSVVEPVPVGAKEGKIPDFKKDSEEEIIKKLTEDEEVETETDDALLKEFYKFMEEVNIPTWKDGLKSFAKKKGMDVEELKKRITHIKEQVEGEPEEEPEDIEPGDFVETDDPDIGQGCEKKQREW